MPGWLKSFVLMKPGLLLLHNVLRFQIPVDDSNTMRRFQRQTNLPHNLDGLVRPKLALFHQEFVQVASLHKFHCDKFNAIDFR